MKIGNNDNNIENKEVIHNWVKSTACLYCSFVGIWIKPFLNALSHLIVLNLIGLSNLIN